MEGSQTSIRYSSCLPQYHVVLEYMLSRLFKILFGKEHAGMLQLFVRAYWPKATVTNVSIEEIKKSKKGTKECRILKAVLHAGFTLEELNRILKEHENLMDGYDGSAVLKAGEADCSNVGDISTDKFGSRE